MNAQTEFEKPRGVNKVEIRPGFALVEVAKLAAPVEKSRLDVLSAIAKSGISVDFLKLTPNGISCLIPQAKADIAESTLMQFGAQFNILEGRSIVLVHAVNMRDEEGLIASIVSSAILGDASIEHLSDMHDRMLIVCPDGGAEKIAAGIQNAMNGGGHE